MTREWRIAIAGAVLCHVGVAFAVPAGVTRKRPAVGSRAVEVTLVAARTESVAAPVPALPVPSAPEVAPRPAPAPKRERSSRPLPAPVEASAPVTAPVSAPAEASTAPRAPARSLAGGAPAVLARPSYARNPAPEYPASARRRRQQGVVLLRVEVTPLGRAAHVALARSSGVAALDEAAVGAVRGWEFEPARDGGTAVDCEIEVPVRFRLAD